MGRNQAVWRIKISGDLANSWLEHFNHVKQVSTGDVNEDSTLISGCRYFCGTHAGEKTGMADGRPLSILQRGLKLLLLQIPAALALSLTNYLQQAPREGQHSA